MGACWNCGQAVSDDTEQCPNCQAELPGDQPTTLRPTSNPIVRGIAWAVLAFLAIGAVAGLLYLLRQA
jgi:predicted amidophosphoribosyltransferase